MMNTILQLLLIAFVSISVPSNPPAEKFSNPILAGFYPDPSICRVGSDCYLVTSTFSYFPGIPIFHSRDLVHWKLIGHVMSRPEQLNLDGQGVSRGLFAPTIRYNKGTFYVVCTQVDRGGNFIVTAQSPEGPWSNPVWLPEINGIDPSPFFDEDGKGYIVYNSIPPDNKPLYGGHRTIRIRELDLTSLKIVGEEHILVNGGVDIRKKPVWIEAPHILKKDGTYFLIAAEGGTAEQHSEVVFRSNSPLGPYVPWEKNPILTQRTLDPKRASPITCTGHADLVQLENGSWWAVFLGCRPYKPTEQNFYNTGRETFLAPVDWSGEWPIINPGNETVLYHYPMPVTTTANPDVLPHGGNFETTDPFDSRDLNPEWVFLRTVREKWYNLEERPGWLAIHLRPETCAGAGNPGFIAHRQQHAEGSASVSIDFTPKAESEKAGLLIFQNESHFYFLCKSMNKGRMELQVFSSVPDQRAKDTMQMLASHPLDQSSALRPVGLRIEAHGSTYAFCYSVDGSRWKVLKDSVDAAFLSTRVAGGFVGCMYAMYATSSGAPSNNTAYFDWFRYEGNDEVYR